MAENLNERADMHVVVWANSYNIEKWLFTTCYRNIEVLFKYMFFSVGFVVKYTQFPREYQHKTNMSFDMPWYFV